jgi:Domain of unknown function (DUF1906)/FG-GAP-like repeat
MVLLGSGVVSARRKVIMGVFAPASRKRTIRAAFCVAVVLLSSITLSRADATVAPAFATVQPGTFAGYAFDACTAPSSATMSAWLKASPYRAIGIYFGGANRGCTQANLTPDWVRTQVTAGWRLIPLYVGPQASCTTATKKNNLIDNATAGAQGRAAAADAVAQATALGLARQSVLTYDMENYRTDDPACGYGVLEFMNGWTSQLHDLGYFSGFYSSLGSGVADQVATYAVAGYARPDYLDFARWDQAVAVTDPAIPDTAWSPHRRIKQYRGGHAETWGGVTINIDNDYVDVAVLPPARMADFTGNGWSDVLARTSSTGNLFLYPGNGTVAAEGARRRIGTAWKSMNAIVRIGDLNRDGHEDVVARQTNGNLWFYPGTGAALGSRKRLATKWSGLREITAIGDLNKDGYPDLLAVQASNHNLYFYPGKAGSKLGTRKFLAGGWNTRTELAGAGDFNRDGYPDLLARQSPNGELYLYPGRKGALGARVRIATGWNGMRDLIGVGDFNRDGYPDVAAVVKSSGKLMLYPGTGGGLRPGVLLATGYGGRSPLL